MKLRGQAGYAMAVLLVGLGVMAVMMTVVMSVWKQTTQREKEAELVFRGEQYARAIGLFQRKMGPGVYPPNIDVLVEQRFLRKKFKDPITNDDFAPVMQMIKAPGQAAGRGAPTPGDGGASPQRGGGASRLGTGSVARAAAPGATFGTSGAGAAAGGILGVASKSKDTSVRLYKGRNHYNEWEFVYAPQVPAPAGGALGQPQPGDNPFAPGGGIPGRGDPGGRGPGGATVPPSFPPNPSVPPRRPGG